MAGSDEFSKKISGNSFMELTEGYCEKQPLVDTPQFSPLRRQVLLTVAPFLLLTCIGICSGYSAILLPQLKSEGELNLTEDDESWIASIIILPVVPGCLLSGIFLEKFGCKLLLTVPCVPYIAGCIVLYYSKTAKMIMFARFLQGMLGGALGPSPSVYVGETSDPKYRGLLLASLPLARAPLTHPKKELLGPFGRFRNENYEIYLKKKEEFFTTVKSFKKNNELALVTNWNKLSKYSEDLLQFDFEQDVPPVEVEIGEDGALIRERSERPAHIEDDSVPEICCLQPWFKRYLILCKFIWAARAVILKNRLLKNLEKLRLLDKETVEELEKSHRRCENVLYAELFEKFIEQKATEKIDDNSI